MNSVVEKWGHNAIADGLYETKLNNQSLLAFGIYELLVEAAYTNVAPFEYAAKGITHIVLSPFKEDYKVLLGIDYLLNTVVKVVVAVLFDNFILFLAGYRLITLSGQKTAPLFQGPTDAFNNKMNKTCFLNSEQARDLLPKEVLNAVAKAI